MAVWETRARRALAAAGRFQVAVRAAIDGALFGGLATDGWTSMFWAGIFMFLTVAVVATGIGKGIESACKVLMPILIVMILGR